MSISRIRRAALSVALSAVPSLALAQSAPTDFKGLADLAVNIMSGITAVLIGVGVVYYLASIAISIFKSGQGGTKNWDDLRRLLTWGILIFTVMFLIWAILRVLGNTLFGSDNFSSFGS